MVQALSRYPKLIAWFLTTLFYLELLAVPVTAKAKPVYFSPGRPVWPLKRPGTLPAAPALPVVAKSSKLLAPVNKKAGFTTGPTQPEMKSFQSVNANNMVDLFTGDFSYNIPLLDVGGYPVNIHYQSGITMDQEASWVGLGWNINPGVISRNMCGLPDDFNGEGGANSLGDRVTKTLSIKPNRTIGVAGGGNIELFGGPLKFGSTSGVFYNNYKGWGTENGINVGINAGTGSKGSLSGGLSITNNSQNGLSISPSLSFQMDMNDQKTNGSITIGTNYNSRTGIQSLQISGEIKRHGFDYKGQTYSAGGGISSNISFSRPSYTPTITLPFTSNQFSLTGKIGFLTWALHPSFYIRGYGSMQWIPKGDKSVSMPAYGYLNYEKANGKDNALLDFNREKDVAFSETTPHIAVPIYTYDTYSITGEGNGGMFRPYRGDIGFVHDHTMSTNSSSDNIGIDFGIGTMFQAGVDLSKVYAVTKNKPWLGDNAMKDVIGFRGKDSTFENVFFKNPGEKTAVNQQFLESMGDDHLVRVDLTPPGDRNVPVVTASRNLSLYKDGHFLGRKTVKADALRLQREKRTQHISYLTNADARIIGLDKTIRSYAINSFPGSSCTGSFEEIARSGAFRKDHHLSEITVLNADGRRYVYGLPVYNVEQADVTMAVKAGNDARGMVRYTPGNENSIDNSEGKDAYFKKEEVSSYAHSFLLSGILSPDYVDITGDGITDDDAGDAIRFNYSRIYSTEQPYRWRAPYAQDSAFHDEGLKTDRRDEKGSYSYGSKEIWYLNSLESKNMIATFVLETGVPRKDGYGVLGENGGRNTAQKLYRLKEINLYTKADYAKNGAQARPVKTVHFGYRHLLCKNAPGTAQDSGKLTLQRIWFTYNKNNKGERNPYVFTYHDNNPAYSHKSFDRWGNYKEAADNPGNPGATLSNADYPYALQLGVRNWDSAKAALNAAAWTLSEVKLPSGGKIKVSYEADDYAYVQNRRAMQFFEIVGLGDSVNASPALRLYSGGTDYRYVFVQVTEQVNNKHDITRKYLEGVSKLFFKLMVKVPGDRWGEGYETVPCYADIEDYGVKGNPADKMIWICLKKVDEGKSPLATAAIQFLRLNLTSKAYPFSEPGDNVSFRSFIGALLSISGNITQMVEGFGNAARGAGCCKEIADGKSFIRLNNPVYRKLGGGLRVKRVEVYDNWDKMTNQQQATYGQEYDYSTTIDINGDSMRISSGVATYEPVIGNDENPFRVPIEHAEKTGVFGPTNYLYAEEPFAETFFPAPMVGYSKVRVQSVHKDKKSASGLEETEFYTAREFPTVVEFTPLDDSSKRRFNPKVANLLKFDKRHSITLSQGFKIELNDMHGKMKSQASYAQTDLTKPIRYTHSYFRLQNDNPLRKKLSNTVPVAEGPNGVIKENGLIGKEVELMVDVREQTSVTISGSVEGNVIVSSYMPPIISGSVIPLPSMETDRYRSIAVLKIVNRYGILDSVIHIDKGSLVTTRNQLYDAETGDVLLSQTNNEFDDPVYNFNYPAHWAYSGMGFAYKNMGITFKDLKFKKGLLYKTNGVDSFPVTRYFESGDEILFLGKGKRKPVTNDHCVPDYYQFEESDPLRLWAIDAAKGKEGHKGIYFIDKNGVPFSGDANEIRIIRSGRRNIGGATVGSVTSLQTPVKLVNGQLKLVIDSVTGVIAANAGRFRDFWKVDSTSYAKDTIIRAYQPPVTKHITLFPTEIKTIEQVESGINSNTFKYHFYNNNRSVQMEFFSYCRGLFCGNTIRVGRRSYVLYNFAGIPKGAKVTEAWIYLYGHKQPHDLSYNNKKHGDNDPHFNNNAGVNSNLARVGRITGFPFNGETADLGAYYRGNFSKPENVVTFGPTISPTSSQAFTISCTNLIQDMLDDRKVIGPFMLNNQALEFKLNANFNNNRMCFYGLNSPQCSEAPVAYNFRYAALPPPAKRCENTRLEISYTVCPDGAQMEPDGPGQFRCYSLKDTFICKPNINDTAVNPYRWGILGNWRLDRSYVYYDQRKESDALTNTNIRHNGQIQGFMPYWSFSNASLQASADSSRWVWNSEMTLFNNKGFEIENHDPLDRYNAGQYGYNKTLPVAVAQNSKNRQTAFDGFEDYGYNPDNCKNCQVNRFIDFKTANGTLVDTVSHTGKFSYRLNANTTSAITLPVVSAAQDALPPLLSMRMDSIPIVTTTATPKGRGLTGLIKPNGRAPFCDTLTSSAIEFNWGRGAPRPGCDANWFTVIWTGKIQPPYTDDYTFYTNSDDGVVVDVGGVNVATVASPHHDEPNHDRQGATIRLQAGQLYNIRVVLTERTERAHLALKWSSSKIPIKQIIPKTVLYPSYTTTADTLGTVRRDTAWCVSLANTKATNITNPRFSPIQGTKVLVSAWVREGLPCTGSSYTNVNMQLNFNAGSPASFILTPKGNIIEGWQRIEDTLTIPAGATSVTVNLNATGGVPVYFDDIRIHPFNSNIKSFVYNPVNVRLMAELDENNYASFYEYDDDGTLIRVKKETERGVKTIKETRSALIKE